MGDSAIPFIDKVLSTRTSPYLLRLGVIYALNQMPRDSAGSLSKQAKCAIAAAADSNEDVTLTQQATAYSQRNPAPPCAAIPAATHPIGLFHGVTHVTFWPLNRRHCACIS